MFSVKYLVKDDEKERLSRVKDISEFEDGFNTIEGQIELSFTNNTIGFVDNDIPYDSEDIVTWLQLLNEAIIYIEKYNFATIYKLEYMNVWLQFNSCNERIEIKEILSEEGSMVSSYIEKSPKTCIEIVWSDNVSKKEFYDGILKVTSEFINEIKSLNLILTNSRYLRQLIEAYNKVVGLLI